MIRAVLVVFGLWTLFLSGMVTLIRRDAVEPYYLEFQTFEPGSSALEMCRLFYFRRPLECQPVSLDQIATLSPDGQWWAYVDVTNQGEWTLYRTRIRATSPEIVFRSDEIQYAGFYPVWSPDGRWVVVAGSFWNGHNDIFRIELSTGAIVSLASTSANEWFPAWSFDGERIAFNVRESSFGPARLFTMRADGSDVQSLGLQDAFGPVWSPDSEWIIFQSGCSRQELLLPDISSCPEFNFDLYRVNLTDGQINTVTTMPGNEFSVAYSPDGAWVAFASTVSGSRQIYRVRPDGADLQRLTEDGHNYFPPSWVQTPNFVWQPIFLLMTALMMLSFVWWKKP